MNAHNSDNFCLSWCVTLIIPCHVTQSRSSVMGAVSLLSVGRLKRASSFVSQTAADGQNDAAESRHSELPNEDASREHGDICCAVKRCYCSLLWRWIWITEAVQRGDRALTASRGERRKRMREIIAHKDILLKIPQPPHLWGISLHSLSKYLCWKRPHRVFFKYVSIWHGLQAALVWMFGWSHQKHKKCNLGKFNLVSSCTPKIFDCDPSKLNQK